MHLKLNILLTNLPKSLEISAFPTTTHIPVSSFHSSHFHMAVLHGEPPCLLRPLLLLTMPFPGVQMVLQTLTGKSPLLVYPPSSLSMMNNITMGISLSTAMRRNLMIYLLLNPLPLSSLVFASVDDSVLMLIPPVVS